MDFTELQQFDKKITFNILVVVMGVFIKFIFGKKSFYLLISIQNYKKKSIKLRKMESLIRTSFIVASPFQYSNKWNQLAKELFIRSKKQYFRTAKQCRQRWNNYLDPTKTKGNWTLQEDRILVKGVIDNGKKWALITKLLKNKRTQHMVKNRYKSIVIKYRKWFRNNIEEIKIFQQIQRQLFQKTTEKQIQNQYITVQKRNIIKQENTIRQQQYFHNGLSFQFQKNLKWQNPNWQILNSQLQIPQSPYINNSIHHEILNQQYLINQDSVYIFGTDY